jgi:hypothetical protein
MPLKSGKVPADRERQVKKVLAEIEKARKQLEKKYAHCVSLDEEQLRAKLARTNSPTLGTMGWGDAPTGGTAEVAVYVFNPDPGAWTSLYGYLFVGPAATLASLGQALAVADPRFPGVLQPKHLGLTIAANSGTTLFFSLPIPATIRAGTNYQANLFLYQDRVFELGRLFDRSSFVFRVT